MGEAQSLSSQLAELGWLSTAMPERYGGSALGYVALCGAAEELGRVLAPVAFGSSIVLAAEALLLGGSDAQKESYLPRLGSGALTGTLAIAEKHGPLSPRGIGCEWRAGKLSGIKAAVVDGVTADIAIVVARKADDIAAFMVELSAPGVKRTPQASLDPTRPLAALEFVNVLAEPLAGGVGWGFVQRLLDRAAVLLAFEQVGAADAALEMAKDYALERYAFGRPIGSFQAIKHKLADVYVANELARANAYYGAWALDADAAELPLAAATARVAACEALERAARENIQVHGGIAVTWDHACHLYYRRARHLNSCIGSLPQWRDRLAGLVVREIAA